MDEVHEGGCLCGAIRYRLVGEPLTFYACHCTDCQRQTGSAFGLSMFVERTALELLQGGPKGFEVTMPDGRVKRGRFCSTCATRLWGEPLRYPDLRVLRPGTLDDPSAFDPIGHIWTDSARPGLTISEADVHYPGQPDDAGPLLRAWRDR